VVAVGGRLLATMKTTYQEMLKTASFLIESESVHDPDLSEFKRGVLNILAEMFAIEDMETSVRMEIIKQDLEW
jgi:hypothetical protein